MFLADLGFFQNVIIFETIYFPLKILVNKLILGSICLLRIVEVLEPDVKVLTLAIKSPGRPDIVLPIPESAKPKGLWFSLKEGSLYSLKFTFQVRNNIVSGFKYTNTVWKTGVKGNS